MVAATLAAGCAAGAVCLAGPVLGEHASTVRLPPIDRPAVVEAAHVVRPGDSLWRITGAELRARGGPASTAAIADRWPRWYRLNRAVIGGDPDLIHPGQRLRPPRSPHLEVAS